jgi:histone-binding protein RBBP4
MIINQEYKMWKKDAPNLYDLLILHSLDIPSYSFEWLPNVEVTDEVTSHFALLAPNSPETDKCCLMKIKVDVPNENKCKDSFI